MPDEGKMWRRLLHEGVAGIGLSLLLGGGLYAVAFVLGWWDLLSTFFGSFDAMLILIASGPAFLIFRVGAWLWRFWDRLRRKRLIWALTHAHLTLVVLIMLLLATLSAVEDVASPDPRAFRLASDNLMVAVVSYLTYMILPFLVSMTLLMAGTLLAALPPSAILSYFRTPHDAAVGNSRHCHQGAARRRPCFSMRRPSVSCGLWSGSKCVITTPNGGTPASVTCRL